MTRPANVLDANAKRREHVRRVAAQFPALTDDQREQLSRLLQHAEKISPTIATAGPTVREPGE